MSWIRYALVGLALLCCGVLPAMAQNEFPTPTPGKNVIGTVPMCLNNASPPQAVPCGGNAGAGIVPVVAGPSANSAVLKASPGNFYGLTVTPTSAVYIFIINATSLPANATLTPGTASGNLQECLGVAPANLTSTFSFDSGPTEVFSTGITVALSSTACPVLTASAVGTINGRAN